MNKLTKNLLRLSVIFGGLIVLFISAYLVKQTVPFKITSLLREGHPVRVEYEKYEENYDDERFIWFLLEKDSAFSEKEMAGYGKLVRRFYMGFEGVAAVESIENAEYINFENNYFNLRPFMKGEKLTPIGKVALSDPFWEKSLISQDKRALLFNITLSKNVVGKNEKRVLAKIVETRKEWQAKFPQVEAHFIGTKVGKYYFLKEMIDNQSKVTPLLFLLLSILIWFLFRSWKIVFWFFFIMLLSYSFVLSSIILFEKGLNPYSGFALFFVLIVATSDLVHFFSIYLKTDASEIPDRVRQTKEKVFKPCLFTTITTSIGFLSLIFNEMAPVFYFGIYCTLGSIVCFLLTFYLLPLVLTSFDIDFKLKKDPPKFNLEKVIVTVQEKPKLVLIISIFLFGTLGFFSTKLQIDDDFYGKFKNDHELSKSINAFQQNFNFIGSIDIMVSSKAKDILDYSHDGTLESFEEELKKIEGVQYLKSFHGIMSYIERSVRKGLNEEEPKERLRERTESIFHLLNDYRIFDLTYVEKRNEVRVTAFLDSTNSHQLDKVLRNIKDLKNDPRFVDLTIKTMGFSSIRTFLLGGIIENFLKSFAFSLVLIFFIFLVIFRSLKWGLMAMIPNLLPLVFISGMMGLLGVKIEGNLVLLICISLGIAVDDTIHFLMALKKAQLKGHDLKSGINEAFSETSNALLGTTLVFVLSFPTFFLAELKLFQQMGLFIMLALLVALLADFIILPAIFSLLRKK